MNLIQYLLEANLYLAAFWLLYILLFRSETLYQLNRTYLLVTSAIAFIIPLLQFGFLKPAVAIVSVGAMPMAQLQDDVLDVTPITTQPVHHFSLTDYGLIAYGIITITLLIRLIFKIAKLVSLSKQGQQVHKDGFVLVELPGENAAFSFFGYLFINNNLSSSATILRHEEVHIRQKHSWDIIYLELLKIINWFNPAVYQLQKSVKEVHEFIADEQASTLENGASEYADFLISNAYGLPQTVLTNSFFNKNLLKRRIIMLYQKRSGNAARLKYLLTLPLAGGLICASTLAFTKDYGWIDIVPKTALIQQPDNTPASDTTEKFHGPLQNDTSEYAKGWRQAEADMAVDKIQTKVNELAQQGNLKPPHHNENISAKAMADSAFSSVDEVPMFPGGMMAYSQFLRSNIKYPKEAKDNHVHGYALISFIVEKDGSLSNITIKRNPGGGLGEEAERVMETSPKWKPGKVKGQAVRTQFTAPVNFSLNDGQGSGVTIPQMNTQQPIVNGEPVYNAVQINPDFPGGDMAFNDFIRKSVRYPKEARDKNIQGRVFVQFTVEIDGSLTDLKVLRDPGAGLGEEAKRVLAASPKWTPGKQDGKSVRVQYTVPINFTLADDAVGGTTTELYKYVSTHVRYATAAHDRNIQGRVFIQFTVDERKKIQDVAVLRSPDKLLSDEALRVINNFGHLTDAKSNVNYVIPVNFAIIIGENKYETKPAENATPISISHPTGNTESVDLSEVVVVTYKK